MYTLLYPFRIKMGIPIKSGILIVDFEPFFTQWWDLNKAKSVIASLRVDLHHTGFLLEGEQGAALP